MRQVSRRMQRHPGRAEELCLSQQQRCFPTNVDRNARVDLVDEPVVVEVRVGDDHPGQRRVGPVGQSGDRWQGDDLVPTRPQGLAHVEDDAAAAVLHLYAAATDLVRPTMDPDVHLSPIGGPGCNWDPVAVRSCGHPGLGAHHPPARSTESSTKSMLLSSSWI